MLQRYIATGTLSVTGDVSDILQPRSMPTLDSDAVISITLSNDFIGSILLESATNEKGAFSTVATYTTGSVQADVAITAGTLYRLRASSLTYGHVNYDLFVNGVTERSKFRSDAYSRAIAARVNTPAGIANGGGALNRFNYLVLTAATVGQSTGWLTALGWQERFMAQMLTGTAASVTVDGSNDGITSVATIGTFALDVINQQVITPPTKSPYAFIRFTILSADGTVNVGRGA